MKIGDRVRHSGYAIRPKRDYWLGLGDYTRKNRAKQALDDYVAERGTITELLTNGIMVKWNNGAVSRCLPYMVEKVED